MNKWVHPSKMQKIKNESAPQEPVTYIPSTSFDTIKKQVRKKKVSRKSKKERIADKSVSLAKRVGYQTYK